MSKLAATGAARAPLTRSNAPIFWLLFGGGGMLSALLGIALVFITGLAGPMGMLKMDYATVLPIAQHWLGKAFLLAVIALFAWHAAHRLLCTVHDFGVHKTVFVKTIFYGTAAVMTVVSARALLAIGF